MKKQDYIKAALVLIAEGYDPDALLTKLKALLEKKGHTGLYPQILKGLHTALEQKSVAAVPVVRVAHDADTQKHAEKVKAALAQLGAAETFTTHTDDSLIGGFVVEHNHKIIDNSYKRQLVSLYREVTK